jgi:hypothetical protein
VPRLVWAVLCSATFLDERTNNVALHVLEQLNLGVPPDRLPPKLKLPYRSDLVTFWTLDPGEGDAVLELRVRLVSPSNETLKTSDIETAVFVRESPSVRVIFSADDVVVAGPGVYQFEVESRVADHEAWTVNARVPLAVKFNLAAATIGEAET